MKLKNIALRRLVGVDIGENVCIAPGTELDYFYPELIHIGDDVIIGEKAKLLTHEFKRNSLRFGHITIQENAVIGAFSIIRSGVTIAEKADIGFGTVVHKDIPADETRVGAPMQDPYK